MLEVKDLTKTYGDVTALNHVSFKLKEGQITGFLGPNGAGKTTALRIISGFLKQDSGSVLYNGENFDLKRKAILNEIGYLPEDNPLYKNLRVDDFLKFVAKIKNVTNNEELKELSSKCGLDEVLTKTIGNLSKGFKQRVGLAKTLIGNPKFMILDEPTTGLDPNQKEEILELISNAVKNRIVIFSSHNLSEVSEIADNVIIINNGEIVASGKADEISGSTGTFDSVLIRVNSNLTDLKKLFAPIKTIQEIIKLNTKSKVGTEFEIKCSNADETSAQIFETIVKNKLILTKLFQKETGLDDVFKKLTHGKS